MLKKKNDQVFPTSLSEIAFTLIFLLMLLLGYMVLKEQKEKEAAQSQLAKVAQVKSIETVTQGMQEANRQLTNSLASGGQPKPSEVITQLTEAIEVRAERDKLLEQERELREKLSALSALREEISKVDNNKKNVAQEEIESALVLQDQIRKLVEAHVAIPAPAQDSKDQESPATPPQNSPTNTKQSVELVKHSLLASSELHKQIHEKFARTINPGEEPGAVREVVIAAKHYEDSAKSRTSPEALKKDNADLRGQLAYMSKIINSKGGLDHAPCWANENGKIEYLFNIQTQNAGFVVSKGWLPHREQSANDLPGIEQALSGGAMSASSFAAKMQPILLWSKKQDPECRHFVSLSTTISDADSRDKARKHVEGFFYKFESSR